ncbi:MAG: undecaprenyl-diphosphatase [Candidatus Sumerlaeota bacterium]|nr:undecaprenyl-diphosphatase [Candidatus Sumerlaeota bacterium]
MTLFEAIILGVVEGLTEFLPVSSTGHLLLVNGLLGLEGEAANSYAIVIQLGALLACAVYYRARVFGMLKGVTDPGSPGFKLALNLFVAFLPAAVVGLLAEDFIEERLMSHDGWIAAALVLGGIVMIVVEKMLPEKKRRVESLEEITPKDAFVVGVTQCFALWPGMSRSMSTIVGGQLRGFSNSLAADFSFLLALPTLGAATVYKMVSDYETLTAMEGGVPVMLLGLVVSFLTGWAAIAWFLKVLKRIGMTPFGAYRIIVGIIVVLVLFLR